MQTAEVTDWAAYFKGIRDEKRKPAVKETPEFIVLRPARPVLHPDRGITATQKRIWTKASGIGFEVQVRRAVLRYSNKYQKSDGKTAQAGDLVKPAHNQVNVFMVARYPKSNLGLEASWYGTSFSGKVFDPVGTYKVYGEPGDYYQWRVNSWLIKGSKEFEAWLKEWGETLASASD